MILIFLLYFLFACTFVISKFALTYSQPIFFLGSRMLVAGLLLLGYQKINNRKIFPLSIQSCLRILTLGIFMNYLTNVFEYWGLRYLTTCKTCFIYSLSPFISALLCFILFAEKLNFRKWLGLIVGFMGIIPILVAQTVSEKNSGSFFVFSWAEIWVVLATICSVYGWIVLKQIVLQNNVHVLTANGLSMLFGGVISIIHSFIKESWEPLPTTDFMIFGITALSLIFVSNIVCYNLYGFLLKRYSATYIALAGLITPIFTALLGYCFYKEVLSQEFYISFFFVLLGLVLFEKENLIALYKQKKGKGRFTNVTFSEGG